MNLIRSAMGGPLLEELGDALEGGRLDLIAHGPFTFALQRNGGIDNRYCVSQPAAKALHFANNFDVLVPVDAGGDRPHHFAFVEHIDVIVDDHRQLQVRHLDERLHAGFVGFVFEFLFDGNVADAAAAARSGEVNAFNARNIFFDDVIGAAFLRNAAEIPVVHVAGPEVFDNTTAPMGDCGDFDDRYVHFRLRVTEDLTEGVLRLANPGGTL